MALGFAGATQDVVIDGWRITVAPVERQALMSSWAEVGWRVGNLVASAGALKLYGMRASFDEIAGKGLARRDENYPLVASLIRAERTHRQARSISYRIGGGLTCTQAFQTPRTHLDCSELLPYEPIVENPT